MRLVILLIFVSFSAYSQAPLELFNPANKWVLAKNKIERKTITFREYNSEGLGINSMVWQFMPDGTIQYDYESDPSIFACHGVDFLDIDVNESSYFYDAYNQTITLTIKGGYASLDDFFFRREYKVEVDGYSGYKFDLIKEYFYNDLTRFK